MSEEDRDYVAIKIAWLVICGFGVYLGWIIVDIEQETQKIKIENFKNAKEIYCPSAYKLVKGDGAFTHDYSAPILRVKVNITEVKDGFLYDDKNQSFSVNECRIRN